MSAAIDGTDEIRTETKKFPKQGTMLREFAYGSPRRERRHLTPETEASRGGRQHAVRARALPRRREQQHQQGQRRLADRDATRGRKRLTPGTEAPRGNGSASRGLRHRAPHTPPRSRKQRRPAAVVRRGVADGTESVVRLTVRATSSRRASVPSSRRAAPDPSA